MIDARRPDGRPDLRHLAERDRASDAASAVITAAAATRDPARWSRDSGVSRTVTSRVSPGRVDPVAGVDARERRPQRLPDLTDGHAERAGEAAVDLDVELRLLPLGRQADVHRARHAADDRRHLVGERLQPHHVGPLELDLDLLLPVAEAAVEIDAVTPASRAELAAAASADDLRLMPLALVLSASA